jgi:MFS family permease
MNDNPDSADPSDSLPAYEVPDVERPASAGPTEEQLRESAVGGHDPYAALRYPSYVWFSIGWMLAVIGWQITATAIGWEIYERLKVVNVSQARLALGWVAGIQAIPIIFLALPAGVMADTFDRRRLIKWTAILAAACSAVLAWLSYRPGSIPWIYLVLLVQAAFLAVGMPARSALIPQLVPLNIYSNAATWNASVFQVASMVGPALGGLLIWLSLKISGGLELCYGADALLNVLFFLVVWRLPRPQFADPPDQRERREPQLRRLMGGIRFVGKNKIILDTLTLDLFAVLLGGAVYLMPIFATDILNVGAVGFGWLRAAEAIGAFTMAILLAHLPPMKHAGRAMLIAVGLFGVATIVFGVSKWYWLSFCMVLLIGAFDNISVVVRHTLVQVLTPDSMRGRVSAVNNVFIGASNQIGGLESGLTAWLWGAVGSVVFGGIGTIATVLCIAWIFPQVRRFGSLAEARPAEREATEQA